MPSPPNATTQQHSFGDYFHLLSFAISAFKGGTAHNEEEIYLIYQWLTNFSLRYPTHDTARSVAFALHTAIAYDLDIMRILRHFDAGAGGRSDLPFRLSHLSPYYYSTIFYGKWAEDRTWLQDGRIGSEVWLGGSQTEVSRCAQSN